MKPQEESENSEPGTVIVALTAHAFEEEKEKILAAGCDDFVRKPFKEAEIFEVMERHLGVQYIYEESKEQRGKNKEKFTEDILTPEVLAELPSELLAELKQAVIDLDVERISAVIDQIRDSNAAVAGVMADMAKNFEYDKLLTLIGPK